MEPLIPIADLFKKSFGFYKQNLKTMVTVAAIGYAPVLACYAVAYALGIDFSNFKALDGRMAVLFSVLSLVIFVANFLVYVCFFQVIKNQGGNLGIKHLFSLAAKNAWSFFWLMILQTICIIAGLILFIIPGIIFAVWFVLSSQVLAFEGLRGKAALARSRQLVKGYWWPVCLRYLVLIALSIIISMIPVLGDPINFLFIVPFCVIFGYFMYEDLKGVKAPLQNF